MGLSLRVQWGRRAGRWTFAVRVDVGGERAPAALPVRVWRVRSAERGLLGAAVSS